MYVQDWDIFAEQAEALYRSDPLKVRYVLKYRHCDGKAILKVTDDKTARSDLVYQSEARRLWKAEQVLCVQALQYRTDQIADLKKIEKLNLLLFTLMSQGSDAESKPGSLCPHIAWQQSLHFKHTVDLPQKWVCLLPHE